MFKKYALIIWILAGLPGTTFSVPAGSKEEPKKTQTRMGTKIYIAASALALFAMAKRLWTLAGKNISLLRENTALKKVAEYHILRANDDDLNALKKQTEQALRYHPENSELLECHLHLIEEALTSRKKLKE